jgi:squalene-hopene/tetraprenyl-beta-curcumene cyclase
LKHVPFIAGVLACLPVAVMAEDPPHLTQHLEVGERLAIDGSLRHAREWLLARENSSGAFQPAARSDVCPVALTAMALWALAETAPAGGDDARVSAAVRFLLRHRQPKGGIFDPDRGLAAYTSGVSANALRACKARGAADREIEEALPPLELFVGSQTTAESIEDARAGKNRVAGKAAEKASEALRSGAGLTASERAALELIARTERAPAPDRPLRSRVPAWRLPGGGSDPFGYDDLLPFLYRRQEREHPAALRAYEAVKLYYTLDRNPDLTRRYGRAGFVGGEQGLYYYYLTLAKVLSTFESPVVQVRGGERHDWPRELSAKLMSRQASDGSWVNTDEHWWEDEPVLVTAYAMLALDICRDAKGAAGRP